MSAQAEPEEASEVDAPATEGTQNLGGIQQEDTSMADTDNQSGTQSTNAGQTDPAEAYVNNLTQAESVLKEEQERERQDSERKRRVDEARRILAAHREQLVAADPQISGANKLIFKYAAVAAGAAAVTPPMLRSPIISLGAVAGIQLKMLADMAKLFNQPFSEDVGKAVIASLTGSVGTTALALPTVAGVLQMVPVIGGIASRLSYAVVAYGSTYATGVVFRSHFLSGGTLLNFDPLKARELYSSSFREGARSAPQPA